MFLKFANAQNLVTNPGFELSTPQCALIFDKAVFKASGQGWQWATLGTADIYNTLVSSNCDLRMPRTKTTGINETGSQIPRSGNFLGGLIPFGKRWPGNYPPSYPLIYREYLEVPLTQPLEVGKTYCASMYVVKSDKMEYAANNLGMYFSDTLIDLNNFSDLIFSPQVNETSLITDTANWVRISGCFVATSPAKYLLIGNFKTGAETNFQLLYFTDGYSSNYWNTYYYIDDVSVIEYSDAPLLVSNDTTVCTNTTARLSAQGPDFIWWSYDNEQDTIGTGNELLIKPDTSKTIIAHGKNCNCNEHTDTIRINVFHKEIFELGNDTSLCLNQEVEKYIDNSRFVNPVWNINFINPYHISVSNKGIYSVVVSDYNGCQYSDSFRIKEVVLPPSINLPNEKFICEPNTIFLPEQNCQYSWDDGDTSHTKKIDKAGIYILTAFNSCGTESDTIIIKDRNGIFAPNLVTLNGDNKNDQLIFTGLLTDSYGHLEIYNRWGERIYMNSQYKNEWPALDIFEGVYYYYYQYDSCVHLKGWVEVIK